MNPPQGGQNPNPNGHQRLRSLLEAIIKKDLNLDQSLSKILPNSPPKVIVKAQLTSGTLILLDKLFFELGYDMV